MTHQLTTGQASIEPRFVLWTKIRLPLAVGVLVIILVVSGLLLRSILVDRGIRRDLIRAAELVALDSFASHQEARELIGELARAHPSRSSVVTRDAWHQVVAGLRFGFTPEQRATAKQAVDASAALGADPLKRAVQAGFLLTDGDPAAALSKIGAKVSLREEMFVTAVALAEQGQPDQAIKVLDQGRQGIPPFAPALTEMARLLRQQGRLDEAQAALKVLKQVSPGHEDAAIEEVLLALDRPGPGLDEATQATLMKTIKAVAVDGDHVRSLAWQNQGVGRLLLMAGEQGAAVTKLSQAAGVLKTSQAAATWLARAHRQLAQPEQALEALSVFPDLSSSSEPLLQTRAEVLLDLHRTDSAAAPLAVLTKTGTAVARVMEGRRLLYAGLPGAAAKTFRVALKQRHPEAGLWLGQALMEMGRADRALGVLREVRGETSIAACARGLQYFITGNARRSLEFLDRASRAGDRCGATLTGDLLLESGGSVGLVPQLEKVLAQREDLYDRVTLARVRFRVEGVEAARAELDRVRALNPQGAKVLRALALAYAEIGQSRQGLEVAMAATSQTKGHPLVAGAAVRLALETRRSHKVPGILKKAVQEHPLLPYLAMEQANYYLAETQLGEAEEAVQKALQPGPWFGRAACVAGTVTLRREGPEKAVKYMQRLVGTVRRSSGALEEARVRGCLFDLHLRRGPTSRNRAKGAVYVLRRMPLQWSRAAYMAGQLAEREGKRTDAVGYYREAISLDPADLQSWRRLERLGALTGDEREKYQLLWPSGAASGQ
jgi:tetratricopeptide (TPR) repeat protein